MGRVLRWWGAATDAVGPVTAWLLVIATLTAVLAAVVVTADRPVRPPAPPAAARPLGSPEPGTSASLASSPSSAPSPTSDGFAGSTPRPMPTWRAPEEVLPPGDLDPAAAPWGRVERASVLLQVYGSGPEVITLAADADTGAWLRPAGLDFTTTFRADLSPDGRTVLVGRFTTSGSSWLEVATLATGTTRRLAVLADCAADAAAWAPDSTHLAMALDCVDGARLIEVNPGTGAQREVERVPSSYPEEDYPSYSPDGRYVVYSLVTGLAPDQEDVDDDDVWPGLRVVDLSTGAARTFEGAHVTYGDPWLDGSTLLAWDELGGLSADEGPSGLVLLHADSGSAEPFDHDRGDGLGFAGGVQLVDGAACAAAACVDVPDGTPLPWLRLPDGWRLWGMAPSLARDAFLAD